MLGTAESMLMLYIWIHFSLIVFPSDIWCKINKLLKYYEYQITKRCLEGSLEGFKVSFMVSNEITILVEYRIAKKHHDFQNRCR